MALPSGIDTATKITPAVAQKAKEAGQSFIGRYLVPNIKPYDAKALTVDEAKVIHDAGLGILLCWELTASRAKSGSAAGTADGKTARELAQSMKVPHSAAIYFAVDYNAPQRDYDLIESYLRAAAQAVAPYAIGVYGHYYVCEEMYLRGVTQNLWQCCAWSGKLISPHAFLYQRQWSGGTESKAVAAKIGVSVDMNTCGNLERAKIWMPPEPRPWYAEAQDWVKAQGISDGDKPDDPATRAQVWEMLRRYSNKYNGPRYSGLIDE